MDSNEEITHEEFVKYMRGRGYHWDLPIKYIKVNQIKNKTNGFRNNRKVTNEVRSAARNG